MIPLTKVLVDTNIILDAFLSREPWEKEAQTLLMLAEGNVITIMVTAKQIADLYYLCHKATHSRERAYEIIALFASYCEVLDAKGQDCIMALSSGFPDFEDAMLVEAAKRAKVEYILTRNTKDFFQSPIPAITAGDFIDQYQDD